MVTEPTDDKADNQANPVTVGTKFSDFFKQEADWEGDTPVSQDTEIKRDLGVLIATQNSLKGSRKDIRHLEEEAIGHENGCHSQKVRLMAIEFCQIIAQEIEEYQGKNRES